MRQEVKVLVTERNEYQSRITMVDDQLSIVKTQLDALEEVAERFGVISSDPSAQWLQMNRQDATLEALRELGAPSHLSVIVDRLVGHGRDDTKDSTSAALSVLKNKNMVISQGQGIWALPEHITTVTVVTPAPTVGAPVDARYLESG